jgi:hypothetical protein
MNNTSSDHSDNESEIADNGFVLKPQFIVDNNKEFEFEQLLLSSYQRKEK